MNLADSASSLPPAPLCGGKAHRSGPLRRLNTATAIPLPPPPRPRATRPQPGGPYREDSEAMLIARAQLDDGEAQQELYRRHAQAVYQRLTRLLGRDAEREDLLQQVFSELFVGLHRFRGDAQLRTYIYRITSNIAYDHLKRRSRRRWLFGASDDVERAAAQRSPESIAALQQQLDAVWRHLERLTPKKRIALLLRVGEGLSLEEIGEQVGARVSTVAKRIKYARKELARMLERERRARLF